MRKSFGIGVVAIFVLALAAAPAVAKGKSKANRALEEMNDTLAAMGENVRVAYAELLTTEGAPSSSNLIITDIRGNKQLGSDWVPYDPDRWGARDIYWLIDQVNISASLDVADTNAAISRGMATWNNVQCSSIPLIQIPDYGIDWGYVQYLIGFGGTPGWYADLTHAGWLPGSVFDFLFGPDGQYVIGVTYTFVWVDADGNPTDLDGNGKADVAFREIYYNDGFAWEIDATYPAMDVETIALHESGHGLSQAHFGKIFIGKNGKVHFSPRAVMNAVYSGVQHELQGTDVGGHCSIWGSWPNN